MYVSLRKFWKVTFKVTLLRFCTNAPPSFFHIRWVRELDPALQTLNQDFSWKFNLNSPLKVFASNSWFLLFSNSIFSNISSCDKITNHHNFSRSEEGWMNQAVIVFKYFFLVCFGDVLSVIGNK